MTSARNSQEDRYDTYQLQQHLSHPSTKDHSDHDLMRPPHSSETAFIQMDKLRLSQLGNLPKPHSSGSRMWRGVSEPSGFCVFPWLSQPCWQLGALTASFVLPRHSCMWPLRPSLSPATLSSALVLLPPDPSSCPHKSPLLLSKELGGSYV